MLLRKYLFSHVKVILLFFSFMYFIFPLFLEELVGDDFYIYSSFQSRVWFFGVFFFFLIVLLIFEVVAAARRTPFVYAHAPRKELFFAVYWGNLIYMLCIVVRGLLFRITGAGRSELLEYISSQLLPGYGYVLLLAIISIVHLKRKKLLFVFIGVSLMIDVIYQGKIFMTFSIFLFLFFLDEIKYPVSLVRLLFIGLTGGLFIFLIFTIRAISGGGNLIVDAYSFFSEFMGVNATIGWGVEYFKSEMPLHLFDFDFFLQSFYVGSVGHGLALSPAAYFVGNFGDYYAFSVFVYFFMLWLLYRVFTCFLGRYALLVFAYDFIHLLRHGPNLFLSKSISHMIFLLIILLFLEVMQMNSKRIYSMKV